MALFKRNSVWHADFWFKKTRHQFSTRCTNHEKAKAFVAAYRTNLALTGVGLVQREPPPALSTFLETSFLDAVRQQHSTKPNTLKFYLQRIKVLSSYPPFQQLTLDGVGELAVQGYKDFRLGKTIGVTVNARQSIARPPQQAGTMSAHQVAATGTHQLSIATINAELRVLRKALRFADKCGLARYRGLSTLPGEKSRNFVLSGEMEIAYLSLAPYPLKQAAILMLDLGLRPGEVVSLRKSSISNFPPTVAVLAGKTVNAKRTLPQTERTRQVFELCFALHPASEWVFPGLKGGHYTRVAMENLHVKLRRKHGFPETFLLHSCRHTMATRLAESSHGDVFVLMKALGHSNPKQCAKYIHPSADYLGLAMKRKELLDKLLRGEIHDDINLQDVRLEAPRNMPRQGKRNLRDLSGGRFPG